MEKVSFFTAINFGDQPKSPTQSLLQTVDSYFYLGGRKACVIPGHSQQGSEGTILKDNSPAFFITAIKVISYATVILPAIMLLAKVVLRSMYTFHVIQPSHPNSQSNPIHAVNQSDAEKKLGEGLDISQDAMVKIQQLMPKIAQIQDDAEIIWHKKENILVFSLESIPNLIFKMANPKRMALCPYGIPQKMLDQCFANMIKAKEICDARQLDLLTIPRAKKLVVEGNALIAEERIDFCPNKSAQEELYRTSNLNETVKQLAVFISKSGFSDVKWDNVPIINEAILDHSSPRKVALINLQNMHGAPLGIFGTSFDRGLIRCLNSEEQIDIVLAEAQRHGIHSPLVTHAQAKEKRMKEIQSDQQLQEFYAQNGILENPSKPIQVHDLTTLGLNLDEQRSLKTLDNSMKWKQKPITLREAAVNVIADINRAINENLKDASIKGKRYISLSASGGNLQGYHQLGLPDNKYCNGTKEEEQQTWMVRIINALVAKG